MSDSGEGTKGVDEVVGRPEVLAAAEARLRAASGREATTREILSRILGASPRDVAREVAATLWKPLTAILAAGVLAGCLSDIDSKPPVDNGAASAGANPGPSGSAGTGGEPPDPDKWGKMEGALFGNPDFTLKTPATKPAFDQPETKYWDTAQCEIDGQPYTLFVLDGDNMPTLQFAQGNPQSPEDAMSSPTADFVEGFEEFLPYHVQEIACYKDKIILGGFVGGLKMATLVKENGVLKATDIVELPFSSDEITILVDNGVPYLYYKSGSNAYRTPLDGLPAAEVFEAVPELTMNGSLPAEIIPPDPTTGEGLYFGEKNGIVYAAKTLAGLAASNAVVKELNGNPPAYFTGNVTATPVYNEKGQVIKVYVTFVRQQTEFGKRKLMHAVFEITYVVDPPPPDTDPVPDKDQGDTVEPPPDVPVVADADDLPWELKEDVPEDVPVEEDVPVNPQDPGTPPEDPGTPPEDPGTPPADPGPQPTDANPTSDPDPGATDPGATDPGATDPGTTDPGNQDPDAEQQPTQKLFKFKTGPEYGNCTATMKLLEPEEAKKYEIQVKGTGTEEKPCLAEIKIEGSDNIMLYSFWNDTDGKVNSKCYLVDEAGAAKPFCQIEALNNFLDVVESGEGTEGKVLSTVTGSSASAWTIGYKQGLVEQLDGKPRMVNYVMVRNNETGTTVLMKMNDTVILTVTKTGVWNFIDAETGESFELPELPNPPEGAESLPWELQSGEAQQGELATQPPGGSDPGCNIAMIDRSIRRAAIKSSGEGPAETPSRGLGALLILLAGVSTMAASRIKGKKRA